MSRLRALLNELYVNVMRRLIRSRRAMRFLRRHPSFARRLRPRLVLSYEEAIQVLRQDRAFGVPYLATMSEHETPFVLGLPHSRDHTRQRRALLAATDDDRALAVLARRSREVAGEQLGVEGRIDALGELTEPVLRATMGEFLGTGDVGADELEEARAIFRDIFINPLRARGVHETALAASTNLRRRVDLRVEERRAGATAHADVLGRLLAPNGAARLHGDEVQAQLAGLIVAWAASLPRAMAFTLDWLVDAPEAMARAQLAAEADDLQAVWRVLLEAMQAHPPAPGVERHCLRAGSLQGGPVPCEGQVMVVLTSAMWDPAFAAGARGEGLQNLPFGYGMHQCLGRRIAEVQLSAIAIELLRRPNVRRAGKLEIDGPYPSRLDLAFDAVR